MKPLDITDTFIKNIEALLESKKLKHKDLAERLGVKPPVIAKIIRKGSNPKLRTLAALARAIDSPIDHLVSEPNQVLQKLEELRDKKARLEVTCVDYRLQEKEIQGSVSGDRKEMFRLAGEVSELNDQIKWLKDEIERLEDEYPQYKGIQSLRLNDLSEDELVEYYRSAIRALRGKKSTYFSAAEPTEIFGKKKPKP